MEKGVQNPDLTFEELYEEAREAMPILQHSAERILKDLRRAHPGVFETAAFELGPIKEVDRAMDKITGDYGGDHKQISDLARGRFLVDTPEQVAILRSYLQDNQDGFGIEKMKDRFANPSDTHFRDINMKMRVANGHVTELRVEQRDLMLAAKATHDPYELVQQIDRRAEAENRPLTQDERTKRAQYLDVVRDIHDAASTKAKLDPLLNDDGRKKLTSHFQERAGREAIEKSVSQNVKITFRKPTGNDSTLLPPSAYADKKDADANKITVKFDRAATGKIGLTRDADNTDVKPVLNTQAKRFKR